MAGVRKLASGTWQGWYVDHAGKRQFFTLSKTAGKRETLQTAQDLDTHHRKIAFGVLPLPTRQRAALTRPIEEVISEYLRWGAFQGGIGGRSWSVAHQANRARHLRWWCTTLGLETLADCRAIQPAVERTLQALGQAGRSGATLVSYREALRSFCRWCMERHYLEAHPLARMTSLDSTPRTRRRAMTAHEIQRLLAHCLPHHRLLYQVACLTGLRANELRHLTTDHLDIGQGGLRLDSAWTKNRRDGFQPLPRPLLRALDAFAQSGEARRLYAWAYSRTNARQRPPADPLLVVPQNTALMLDLHLRAAGIPTHTPEGKVDFHALRVAYVTFIFEGGATPPEARELARHHHPELTLGVYARTRTARLQTLVDDVALTILPEAECAPGVHTASGEHSIVAPLQEEGAPWSQYRGLGTGGQGAW
jgi:integrase